MTAAAPIDSATAAAIADCRRRLTGVERVLVLTGAGISKASGIPTYQDQAACDEENEEWLRCDAQRFVSDPCHVWMVIDGQRQRARFVQPNPAHLALARWSRGRPGIVICTQNVDGLHERAAASIGDPAAVGRMLRIHGTLHRGRCVRCRQGTAIPDVIDTSSVESLPHCRSCGNLVRPAVVWFGERLSPHLLSLAWQAAGVAEVCLVIGTNLVVSPAADLPGHARSAGAYLIEVNPQPVLTADSRTTSIALPAELVVPLILDGLVRPVGVPPSSATLSAACSAPSAPSPSPSSAAMLGDD